MTKHRERLEVPTASALQFIQAHGLRIQCDEVARGITKLTGQLRQLNEVVALCEGQ